MKEYLETQEKERQKPNEELDRMTLAKDALDQQLKDLSAQCLKDKGELTNLERRLSVQTGETQRLKADLTKMLAMTKTLNNDNDILRKRVRLRNDAISQIRETLSTTEQRSKSLAKELTEAKQELSQENKNHTSYQESTEKKLISAKDLWRCHKELIELHFRDKDEHVKKAILEALDKEYGIFQYEK